MATVVAIQRRAPWWVLLLEGVLSLLIGIFLVTALGATTVLQTRVLG